MVEPGGVVDRCGWAKHNFNPQWAISAEASYAELNWSNMGGGCNSYGFGCGIAQGIQGPLSPRAKSWIVGGASTGIRSSTSTSSSS